MKAARQASFRLVPRESDDVVSPSGRERPQWLVPAIAGIAIAAALVLSLSPWSVERRAIRALPEHDRAALLSRTVDELRQFCGDGQPGALRDHCRELATFASKFDECRGDCATLARLQLAPAPTR